MAIMMPEKKQSTFSKLAVPVATLAGAGIGSVVPGAGTLAGASLGAALGGAAGSVAKGVADKDMGQAVGGVAQGVTAGAGQGSAMERRLAAPVVSAPAPVSVSEQTRALGEGAQAISDLPPEQQQAYGPKIASAYNQSLRRDFRGMV